jgi:hypothetical protein
MKGLSVFFLAILLWGCENQLDETGNGIGTIENYRLINPNNLFNRCQGYLMFNYASNTYTVLYNFTCIYKNDTVNFYLSESGKFSDSYSIIPYETPVDNQWFYYSGKFSFIPDQRLPWGSTYQYSEGTGFSFTFTNPRPRLITNIPVFDKKMVLHITDSLATGQVKPWIEVIPVETGKCDTIQLYWN